jgi:hypothetical protein
MYIIQEQKSKRSNDSIIKLTDGTYCEARKFIKLNNNEMYAIVTSLEIDNNSYFSGDQKLLQHIKLWKPYFYGKVKAVPISMLKCKSILVNLDNVTCIIDFPNLIEKD